MITPASVDLPDPLGPMSACTSPWRTVRSTPCRISFPLVEACSSLISSVACPFVSAMCDLHLYLVVFHLHVVRRDRRDRRQAPRLARVQVERRAVPRTFDRREVGVDLALVQVRLRVRADVAHRAEPVLAQVDQGDLVALDL